jgi:hypothetical protein
MKHLPDYEMIHRLNDRYGPGPGPPDVETLKEAIKSVGRVRACIDYGCGNSKAIFTLFPRAQVHVRYDFAQPDFTDPPPALRYDVGLCTDVMEHVPEDEIPAVLSHLGTLSDQWLFIIPTTPAAQKLMDGSNAHVTQRKAGWWKTVLTSGLCATVEIRDTANPNRFLAITRKEKVC